MARARARFLRMEGGIEASRPGRLRSTGTQPDDRRIDTGSSEIMPSAGAKLRMTRRRGHRPGTARCSDGAGPLAVQRRHTYPCGLQRMHTNIEAFEAFLMLQSCPNRRSRFSDPQLGGFHRMDTTRLRKPFQRTGPRPVMLRGGVGGLRDIAHPSLTPQVYVGSIGYCADRRPIYAPINRLSRHSEISQSPMPIITSHFSR